ncbi:hypothetical protein Micbo1qcDRAFT_206288 [Microdochium bolleyi]|uniref:F-box domain-containing protein n=1 Tax=Microdochium bolleyi TaxID=196109 RepID=A0A136IWN4_9PEZI|nr:hypothetical protein Micbo1qcDRAFT_206288 [Microdochium bolleyi]
MASWQTAPPAQSMSPEDILKICAEQVKESLGGNIHSCHTPSEKRLIKQLHSYPERRALAGLGTLAKLPNELLLLVTDQLDPLSFFRFRHINRMAHDFATTQPKYNHVARHAPTALIAMIRSQLAQTLTINDLYAPLVSHGCSTCSEFGEYLFLPTLTRCCSIITLSEDRAVPMGTFAPLLDRLRLVSVPARPGPFGNNLHDDYPATADGCGWLIAVQQPRDDNDDSDKTGQLIQVADLKEPQSHLADVLRGILYKDAVVRAVQSRMASVALLWLDAEATREDACEPGVRCKGCIVGAARGRRGREKASWYEDRARAYSSEGFLRHFEACEEAQTLWAAHVVRAGAMNGRKGKGVSRSKR